MANNVNEFGVPTIQNNTTNNNGENAIKSIEENTKSFSKNMEGFMSGKGVINKTIGNVGDTLKDVGSMLNNIADIFQSSISSAISNMDEYMGKVSSRLQGLQSNLGDSNNYYLEITNLLKNTFTNSKYIDQQTYIKKIADAVEKGVAYNLEDRAYLATIADRTVATFDVLSTDLARIIRLQQSDVTRTSMGEEAYLTQFLNSTFTDTSYLDIKDSIYSALTDALSQSSYYDTTELEYSVDKWLGSLYAVGMSSEAISSLAKGINYLGSGNLDLLSDTGLNTFFAMAAEQAGLSYGSILTNGLTGDNINSLFEAMITYLQTIADNTDNEILKSQYGKVFGNLSVSDIRAIQNLTADDIEAISSSTLTYKEASDALDEQIDQLADRTSVATQWSNVINNMMYSIGSSIAETPEAMQSWLLSNLASTLGEDLFGDSEGGLSKLINGVIQIATGFEKTNLLLTAANEIELFARLNSDAFSRSNEDYWEEYQSAGYWQNGMWVESGTRDSLENLVDIFTAWSEIGGNSSVYPFDWSQFTSRGENYSLSISNASKGFATNEYEADNNSEIIQGIESDINDTLDNMYNNLFGNSPTPILVKLDSTSESSNQSSYSSTVDSYNVSSELNAMKQIKGA